MRERLLELAAKCEAAQGPDRELNERILRALGWTDCEGLVRDPSGGLASIIPDFTASLDAAMTLVPEGWWVAGLYFCHPDFRSAGDREWHAEIAGPVTWAPVVIEEGFTSPPEPQYDCEGGNATAPALALCAASLRSLANQED